MCTFYHCTATTMFYSSLGKLLNWSFGDASAKEQYKRGFYCKDDDRAVSPSLVPVPSLQSSKFCSAEIRCRDAEQCHPITSGLHSQVFFSFCSDVLWVVSGASFYFYCTSFFFISRRRAFEYIVASPFEYGDRAIWMDEARNKQTETVNEEFIV